MQRRQAAASAGLPLCTPPRIGSQLRGRRAWRGPGRRCPPPAGRSSHQTAHRCSQQGGGAQARGSQQHMLELAAASCSARGRQRCPDQQHQAAPQYSVLAQHPAPFQPHPSPAQPSPQSTTQPARSSSPAQQQEGICPRLQLHSRHIWLRLHQTAGLLEVGVTQSPAA